MARSLDEVNVYLSHAIGTAENFDALEQRQANIANALAWVSYLTAVTPHVISVPWYANVVALGWEMRDRALRDQTKIMRLHDAWCCVGRAPIGHQLIEQSDARRWRMALVDLTELGFTPPRNDHGVDDRRARAVIGARFDEAVARNRIRL